MFILYAMTNTKNAYIWLKQNMVDVLSSIPAFTLSILSNPRSVIDSVVDINHEDNPLWSLLRTGISIAVRVVVAMVVFLLVRSIIEFLIRHFNKSKG